MYNKDSLTISTILIILFAGITITMALDTTEPFDKGFTDNEMYAGLGGIGLDNGSKGFGLEYVLGIGLNDRIATTLSVSLESNEYFDNRAIGGGLGLYLNIYDSEIFKLDILSCASSDGVFALATEINIDFPKVGFQVTIEEALENSGFQKIFASTGLAPQVYFNIGESLQLLTAVDFIFSTEDPEIGAAGFGLNIGITDAIELITEASFDIPQDDEEFSVGFSLGFVATIP